MRTVDRGRLCVSAVVPAYNEGRTIGEVIRMLQAHPLVDEIIVVSDGSTDDTVEQARAMNVRVIEHPANRGKAAALETGVHAARHEHILLADADIRGFTPEIITRVVSPVLGGDYGMYVAICDRRIYWMNRLLHFTPIIGGERALTKTLWNRVPSEYKQKFQIEIALNFFAKRFGERMGFAVMPGLGQVIKERKRGLWLGLYQRLSMCADIAIIALRLYVIFNFSAVLARRRAGRRPSAVAVDQAPP